MLKYCPFCGSDDIACRRSGAGFTIVCNGCTARTRFLVVERDFNNGMFTMDEKTARQQMEKLWNKRIRHLGG